jgi:RNA-directed DNA polymerase
MRQLELFTDETSLFEHLCTAAMLKQGFKAVKANQGSPGIDGVSIAEFESRLNEELTQLKKELESWSYKPEPVRRVEIPKPGGAGVRLLGVPNVKDRVVQATIKILLEPIFDPTFSNNSYGFRPSRSQRQAVEAAKSIVTKGKEYIVDIDLSKFFDRVNHDKLINRLSKTIEDKRLLRIIGMTLRSGVMKDGVISATTEGTTQGSPLSPLLSNIVLDELDKELEQRGHEFCRFADDCNIFVKTKKAADRVMKSITKFIETKLKLVINREKSKTALSREVKFLGMTIINKTISIAAKSLERAMEKVKELTQRGTSQNMKKTVEEINKWYKGWTGYFSMTQYPAQLHTIEAHIRRRLRARIIDQQKRRRHLYNKLIKQGIPNGLARNTVYSNKRRWALSHTNAIEWAFPNEWFETKWGLITVSKDKLSHWFSVKRWIRLK